MADDRHTNHPPALAERAQSGHFWRVLFRERRLRRTLSAVSIRGRMAFAIECILAFRKARQLESASVDLSVAVLSEFCSSTDLGWWESTALDRIWPLIEKRTIAAETGSNSLQDAIEWAFDDIGRGNLYSAVVGHSETTLSGALKVAAALAARDVALPDASRFSQHSFLDAGGWGIPIAIQL